MGSRSGVLAALAALACFTAAGESRAGEADAGDAGAGRVLFTAYCASCHGVHGRGDGPVAPSLRTQPADLTQLSLKYGVPLPREQLAQSIDGRREVAAHGTRDMPIWGERFFEDEPPGPRTESSRRRTIELLLDHLESIQAARPARFQPAAP